MCDFFFLIAPEEQNTVRIFNVAFSRDGRGSSFGCCYQDLVVSHLNSNFEHTV